MESTQSWFWGVLGTGNGDSGIDGTIDLANNELPWIKFADSVSLDINAGDTAMIKIAKKDMPNWSNTLKVGRNTLALVNKSSFINWNHPDKIKFYGVITKLNPKHNEYLTIKADSIMTILGKTALNDLFDQVSTNPNTVITISGSTIQTLMANIMRYGMNVATAPAGQRPANIMGTYDGGSTGDTWTHEVLLTDFTYVADVLTEWRDRLSPYGNEFRFPPRFETDAMNRIVCDMRIGDDSEVGAHLNESETVTINIETVDDYNKVVEMSTVYDLDGVATRWIGHSKAGEGDTGSDLTTVTNTTTGLPRLDAFFNPGVELSSEEMAAQLSAHLDTSESFSEATYSVEEDFDTKWANHLGKTINFIGTPGTEYADFNSTVRCVSIGFSGSNGSVKVGLVTKQPRYPILPKDRPRGNTGADTKSPIITPTNPNVPAIGGGGPPIIGDDWDKVIGSDEPTSININAAVYMEQLNYMNYEGSYPLYREFWYNGIEGHTIIADDANGRFLGINYGHMTTMWPGKAERGSLADIEVSKSRKLEHRPINLEGASSGWYANDDDMGVAGERGIIMNLDWATVSASALDGTLSGYVLTHEIFNNTLTISGSVSGRTVMLTVHQLQHFTSEGDNKLRSKDFSFKIEVDADMNPVDSPVTSDDSPYKGNASYDPDWTFYAYGNQIACDTSGDIEKTVILTPRAYPKEENLPTTLTFDNNYWASLNQGAYATWNITLIKNWVNGSNNATSGPDDTGKNFRQMTWLQIPWIDQSQVINNTYACTVVGSTVYANSMTAYGKVLPEGGNNFGENRIVKATLKTKPTGLTEWNNIHSGKLQQNYYGNSVSSPFMVFAGNWRRNSEEVAFYDYDGKVLAKNGVDATRRVTSDLGFVWQTNVSFIGQGFQTTDGNDGFTDFYGYHQNPTHNGITKWVTPEGLDYGILVWQGKTSNSQNGQQYTIPNKSLFGTTGGNFSVFLYNTSRPSIGYGQGYNDYIEWSWEV